MDFKIPEDYDPDKIAASVKDEQQIMGEDEPTMALRIMRQSLPLVAHSMVNLAVYADDEKMRFQAGKYLFDRFYGSTSPTSGEVVSKEVDPFENLLAECVSDFNA